MALEQKHTNNLRDLFGLNAYEVKIWTALLSRGIAAAGELSDMSGVPRSRCYDVLESLEKKGFIIEKIGKPIKYIANPPEEVARRVQKDLNADCDSHLKVLDSFSETETFRTLTLLAQKEIANINPEDLTQIVRGRRAIWSNLKAQIEKATKSILIVTTASLLHKKVDTLRTALLRAHERGVAITIATKGRQTNKKLAGMVEFIDCGGVDARFTTIDNLKTMIVLTEDALQPAQDAAVIVESEYVSLTMRSLVQGALAK